MDYGKSFSFVFDDKDWVQKILIGGILNLIPIVNLIAIGYTLRVLKNVATGVDPALPDWDDFADYFVKGLVSILGAVVWALPIILLSILMALVSVPVERMTGYGQGPDYVYTSANLCLTVLGCLSGLYGLFMGAVMPAVMTKYAVSGEFGAFFRFGEIFKYITSNAGPYIIALLLGAVAQFIGGFGLILCIVGVAFTSFWAMLVSNHLLGQVYHASEETSLETLV
jgi:hypothetical protein